MKRFFLLLLTAFAACASEAFDSEDWLAQREMYAREAERLQAAYRVYAAKTNETVEKISIPIETYENGSVKVLLSAERARFFLKEGFLWASTVSIKRFTPTGKVDINIDALNCLVDRQMRSGWVEGGARIVRGKDEFLGTGVYFSAQDGYLSLARDVELKMIDVKTGGAL